MRWFNTRIYGSGKQFLIENDKNDYIVENCDNE